MAPSTRRTPARSTRSRTQAATELPSVPVGTSTSYGAPGRPSLPPPDNSSLLNPPTLQEALQRARKDNRKSTPRSASPEAAHVATPAPERPARRRAAHDMTAQPTATNGHSPVDTTTSLQQEGTSIAQLTAYDPQRTALLRDREKQTLSAQASRESPETASQPGNFTVLVHSIPRYAKNVFGATWRVAVSRWAMLLVASLLLSSLLHFFTTSSLSASWAHRRSRLVRGARLLIGLDDFERPPSKYEQAWHYFRYQYMLTEEDAVQWNMPELQWTYNLQFLTRIEKLEQRNAALEESITILTDQIRDELPKIAVLQLEDGELRVPDGFWLALHSKMTGDSRMWTAFLEANEHNLKEHTERLFDDKIALGEKRSTLVGKDMLGDIIRENYDGFLAEFRRAMDDEHSDLVTHVRKVASQVAADLIARHSAGQMPNTQRAAHRAGSDYLTNHVDEIQSVNYFSPYHGAQVWGQLTSPTAIRKQPSWIAQIYASWYYPPNQPHTALRAWKEVAEAWCAAKSSSPGKAQIGIWTGRPVTPRELIIEHIPRGGTLEIATAPREVELWMDVGSEETAQKVKETTEVDVPSYERIECSSQPAPGFVCVARGVYNIHEDNWVQSIPAMQLFSTHQLKSRKYVVRATSNWGGDHTCFYRLRLKGEE